MKKIKFYLVLFCLFIVVQIFSDYNNDSGKIEESLLQKLSKVEKNEYVKINVLLQDKFDAQTFIKQTKNMKKSEKRKLAVESLKAFSETSQKNILSILDELKSEDKVRNIRTYWIANILNFEATKNTIIELSNDPSIKSISEDILFQGDLIDNPQKKVFSKNRVIPENLEQVNAPAAWDLGYSGRGVVIGVLDTGVNYNHTDLSDHLWIHPDYPNYGYDFHNNDYDPMDDQGHGTSCAGYAAGDGTSGRNTGVAPDATVMILKSANADYFWFHSNHWAGIEFGVEYGADIITTSNANYPAAVSITDRIIFRQTWENVLTVGVIGTMPAGNAGHEQHIFPVPGNIVVGGDCPPPWFHPDQTYTSGQSAIICVGSIDSNDEISFWSSVGPASWQGIEGFDDYPYDPGIGLIKPDIVAPGDDLTGLDYTSNDGYSGPLDGTSLSTPHIAGVFALMLSKNPELTPADLDRILEETADHVTEYKSNVYGSGIADALAALDAVPYPSIPPNPVGNPSPYNQEFDVFTNSIFRWYNDIGAENYQLYLGTDNPPTNVLNGENLNVAYYDISGLLDYSTQYYWRIDCSNPSGSTTGDVWTFTTIGPPSLAINTNEINVTLEQDQTMTQALQLSNIGGGSIEYFISIIENSEDDYGRDLSNSYVECRTTDFLPGSTIPLVFDVYNNANDDEAIKEIILEFPEGVSFNIVNNFAGGSGGFMVYNEEISSDHVLHWLGENEDGIGNLRPGEDAHTGLNVTIDENVIESFDISYQLIGDENGGEPHIVEGVITINSLGIGWCSLESNTGELLTNETDEIDVYFDSNGLSIGTYTAELQITSLSTEQTIIPITLNVTNTPTDDMIISKPDFNLSCYPNPFNLSVETRSKYITIKFNINDSVTETAKISIFNVKGQQIKSIPIKTIKRNHSYEVEWDRTNSRNQEVDSGIYLVRLSSGGREEMQKVVLVK